MVPVNACKHSIETKWPQHSYTALSITAQTTGLVLRDLWKTATGPANNTENSSLKDGVFLRVSHVLLSHCPIEPVQISQEATTIT